MILTMILYLVVLGACCVVAMAIARAARACRLPVGLAVLTTLSLLLYLAWLVPGVLGILCSSAIAVTFVLLAGLTGLVSSRIAGEEETADGGTEPADAATPVSWTALDFAVATLGALAAGPLLRYLSTSLPRSFLEPGKQLPWDTVSYHLPGVIEFLQNHSLWSIGGPYQSYCFGFDLIACTFSHFFNMHWGLAVAGAAAVLFLVLTTGEWVRRLTEAQGRAVSVNWAAGAILAVGLWARPMSGELGGLGKNDVFLAACLTSALALLMDAPSPERTTRPWPRRGRLFLIAAALALALATKPTALAYAPFFLLALPLAGAEQRPTLRGYLARLPAAAGVVAAALAAGSFFLVRNLIMTGGSGFDGSGFRLSVIANLSNPVLYWPTVDSLMFLAAGIAVVPGSVLAWVLRRDWRAARCVWLVLGFHVVSCLAFVITPHTVFHHTRQDAMWDLRLGLPCFVSAAVVYTAALGRLAHVLGSVRRERRLLAIFVLVLAGGLAMPIHWQRHAPPGLSGYESVKGLPTTAAYRWVQIQDRPLRIYSAGLRPYGLVGRDWQNVVFADLHSAGLTDSSASRARMAAVVTRFKADVMLIAVDPHGYSGPPVKPSIVSWLGGMTNCFEEAFADATVTVFRVRPEAARALQSLVPEDYDLRAGG